MDKVHFIIHIVNCNEYNIEINALNFYYDRFEYSLCPEIEECAVWTA